MTSIKAAAIKAVKIWFALLIFMWVGYIILSLFGKLPDPEPVPFLENRTGIQTLTTTLTIGDTYGY